MGESSERNSTSSRNRGDGYVCLTSSCPGNEYTQIGGAITDQKGKRDRVRDVERVCERGEGNY